MTAATQQWVGQQLAQKDMELGQLVTSRVADCTDMLQSQIAEAERRVMDAVIEQLDVKYGVVKELVGSIGEKISMAKTGTDDQAKLNWAAAKPITPSDWDGSDRDIRLLSREISAYLTALHDDGERLLEQATK